MLKRILMLTSGLMVALAMSATAQMPKVGADAPAFVAKDQTGKDVSFPPKGTWSVLFFYPRASTPG